MRSPAKERQLSHNSIIAYRRTWLKIIAWAAAEGLVLETFPAERIGVFYKEATRGRSASRDGLSGGLPERAIGGKLPAQRPKLFEMLAQISEQVPPPLCTARFHSQLILVRRQQFAVNLRDAFVNRLPSLFHRPVRDG